MQRPLEFLEGTWPLIVVRLPTLMNDVPTIQALIGYLERAHLRGERFAVMVDCSAVVKFPGSVERRMLMDWMAEERHLAHERAHTVGTAIVLTSGPMRALMSTMNWVRRPQTPQVWKATTTEAIEWCCQALTKEGIALSPALEALRFQRAR
jgi:hypothetical protein